MFKMSYFLRKNTKKVRFTNLRLFDVMSFNQILFFFFVFLYFEVVKASTTKQGLENVGRMGMTEG